MTASVYFSPRAEAQLSEAAEWWRANRPAAPELLDTELTSALRLLTVAPDIGHPYVNPRIAGARRLLMPRTRYHLYYVHDAARGAVIILALWSAVRGRGPVLRKP